MAVQAGPVARLALRDADDQATRALDRRAGAAALIMRRRHHRVDAPRRYLFHRAGWNVVRLEILPLVGLQLVEPSDTGFHLLGSERFRSHAASPIRFLRIDATNLEGRDGLLRLAASRFNIVHQSRSSSQHNWLTATDRHRDRVSAGAGATRRGRDVEPGAVARGRGLARLSDAGGRRAPVRGVGQHRDLPGECWIPVPLAPPLSARGTRKQHSLIWLFSIYDA